MNKTWMLAMVLALPLGTAAQSDFELAEFYYNEGSYEQAKLYLEQLWKKNKTKKVYDMYYASLLAINDFERAEKLVKSRMRNKNTRAVFRRRLVLIMRKNRCRCCSLSMPTVFAATSVQI